MTMVTEYNWESNSWTSAMPAVEPDDTLSEHARWEAAVATVYQKACEALPAHTARLDLARLLVLDGAVVPQHDGSFLVQSQTLGDKRQYRVNGKCECPGFANPRQGYCKHRLATFLYRRAQEHLQGTPDQAEEEPAPQRADAPTSPAVHIEDKPAIAPRHIVEIQGKAFVRYVGLLDLAQTRGLVSLTADWTYNDAELSLAHAVATFSDGRRFGESGDASPTNCTRKVAVHFRRVALTRAKARVLRDALGIDLVAVEELADSD